MSDHIPFKNEIRYLETNPSKPYVFVLGHSWVNRFPINLFSTEIVENYNFLFHSETNIPTLIKALNQFPIRFPQYPSIIFVFTGANDLYFLPNDLSKFKLQFAQLDQKLKQAYPWTKIVYGQLEFRYYKPNRSRYYDPKKVAAYETNSCRFNKWLKNQITGGRIGNKIFITRSPIAFRKPHFDWDGVHLNPQAYSVFVSLVEKFLRKTTLCLEIPAGPPPFLVICHNLSKCSNCNFKLNIQVVNSVNEILTRK